MSWIERIKSNITPTRKASIPEGVWTKCDSCGQVLYRAELERNLEVCPKCDHHMRMTARNRLHSLLDEGSLVELGSELEPKDVLKFRDSKKYKDRLASAQKETGEKDALVVMKGTLYGMPVVAAAFEFAFMGGSMGSVVGARFVRAVEQRSEFLIEKGAIYMIVRRPEMRLKLASILAKLMNLPAPNPEAAREGVVVPLVPDQEPEA